jgi:hypothetical protein
MEEATKMTYKLQSKLSLVEQILGANPTIVIVKKDSAMTYNPDFTAEDVRFDVAPYVGQYDPAALKEFMATLVPWLKPDHILEPAVHDDVLYFGKQTYNGNNQDAEEVKAADKRHAASGNYARFITVVLYPSDIVARDILEGRLINRGGESGITLSGLNEYLTKSPYYTY